MFAVDYAPPWDRLVADLKFQGRIETAPLLADLLAQAVGRDAPPQQTLVVPVPLSRQRLTDRGFNQAWEIARRVSSRLGLEAGGDVLTRPVETLHQGPLDRAQRASNVRGALMVEPTRAAGVAGRHVAVVDDVFTTGATVTEAVRALRQAQATSVEVWTVARTP